MLNAALSLSMLEKTLANAPAVPHRVFRVQPSPVTKSVAKILSGHFHSADFAARTQSYVWKT